MTAQVILVGMDDAVGKVEELLDGVDFTLHTVEDLDECMEMAHVTGADLIVASTSAAGLDPLEVVARFCTENPQEDPPFAFMDPVEQERTRVVRRAGSPSGEFAVSQPPTNELGRVLRILVSGERALASSPVEVGRLKDRLTGIGYNDKVDVGDRRYSIQTEVTLRDGGAVVRSKVYEMGRIILSREFPADLGDDPVTFVERLASDVHRESCVSVVLQLAEAGSVEASSGQ